MYIEIEHLMILLAPWCLYQTKRVDELQDNVYYINEYLEGDVEEEVKGG